MRLRIVERGDLAPSEMRGAWAGEIGQTQFMPSSWIKYAVDFDGNGRRDLLHSAPDVLASTANYLASYGWQRGKDWEPGSANFAVIQQWNKSEVYAKTIAYFATQLAHAPECFEFAPSGAERADRGATGPSLPAYFIMPACIALLRCIGACAHLAVEHRGLRHRDFLLRRRLAVAVGHGFDHGFGLLQVFATAAAHAGGRRGNGRVHDGSHCGCSE